MKRIDSHQGEIEISFDSAKSATMRSDDEASIFYFSVKNLGAKRAKIFVSNAVYTTVLGEDIDHDVWLSGFGNGAEGFSLTSSAFKKIGCVFYKNKLPRLLAGDKITLTGRVAGGTNICTFIFHCTSASASMYQLLSTSVEPSAELGEKFEVTGLVERLELLEEKIGVRFEGIYAVCEKRESECSTEYSILVNFDIVATDSALGFSFKPRLNAYNAEGQLLSTETDFINKDSFLGIQSCKIRVACNQIPSRMRLFPSDPF